MACSASLRPQGQTREKNDSKLFCAIIDRNCLFGINLEQTVVTVFCNIRFFKKKNLFIYFAHLDYTTVIQIGEGRWVNNCFGIDIPKEKWVLKLFVSWPPGGIIYKEPHPGRIAYCSCGSLTARATASLEVKLQWKKTADVLLLTVISPEIKFLEILKASGWSSLEENKSLEKNWHIGNLFLSKKLSLFYSDKKKKHTGYDLVKSLLSGLLLLS